MNKSALDKSELEKVQNYLRRLFGNPEIKLAPRMQREDMAEVYIGGELNGMLTLDTEDGDRSYNLQIGVPETGIAPGAGVAPARSRQSEHQGAGAAEEEGLGGSLYRRGVHRRPVSGRRRQVVRVPDGDPRHRRRVIDGIGADAG